MTVRRAIETLIAEGHLERRHGSGTYVLPRPCVRLLGLTSFTTDMLERGMEPGSRLLAFGRGPAHETLARQLHVKAGTEVVSFTRLRLADTAPMAVETVWIPQRLVVGLTGEDLEHSFYELLASRYGTAPHSAMLAIEPVIPTPRIREHLEIGVSQPCLRIRMTTADTRENTIMYANCFYRGDRYQLQAEIIGAAFGSPYRQAV